MSVQTHVRQLLVASSLRGTYGYAHRGNRGVTVPSYGTAPPPDCEYAAVEVRFCGTIWLIFMNGVLRVTTHQAARFIQSGAFHSYTEVHFASRQ